MQLCVLYKKFQQNQVEKYSSTQNEKTEKRNFRFRIIKKYGTKNSEIERSDCCWVFCGGLLSAARKYEIAEKIYYLSGISCTKYTTLQSTRSQTVLLPPPSSLILLRQVTMWSQLTKLPKEIYLPLTVYIILHCTQFPFRPVQYIQEGL